MRWASLPAQAGGVLNLNLSHFILILSEQLQIRILIFLSKCAILKLVDVEKHKKLKNLHNNYKIQTKIKTKICLKKVVFCLK